MWVTRFSFSQCVSCFAVQRKLDAIIIGKVQFSITQCIKIGVAATMGFSMLHCARQKLQYFQGRKKSERRVTLCVVYMCVCVWVYGSMPLCVHCCSRSALRSAPGLARGIFRMALCLSDLPRVGLAWMQVCTSSLCQLFSSHVFFLPEHGLMVIRGMVFFFRTNMYLYVYADSSRSPGRAKSSSRFITLVARLSSTLDGNLMSPYMGCRRNQPFPSCVCRGWVRPKPATGFVDVRLD